MRSFAIDEPGSPVRAHYATLVTTTTDGGAIEEGQKKRFCLQDLSLLWWFHRKFLRFDIVGFLGFSLLTCAGTKKLICNFFSSQLFL